MELCKTQKAKKEMSPFHRRETPSRTEPAQGLVLGPHSWNIIFYFIFTLYQGKQSQREDLLMATQINVFSFPLQQSCGTAQNLQQLLFYEVLRILQPSMPQNLF